MAYQGTAAGFMARLVEPASEPPATPAPAPERAPGGDAASFLRKTLAPQGVVAGYRLARSCLLGKSTLAADFQLLYDEMLEARPGPTRNYALGRFAGYVAQLDAALDAARAAGLNFDFAPIDEVAELERLTPDGR